MALDGRKVRAFESSHCDAFFDVGVGIALACCMVGSCDSNPSHEVALEIQSTHLYFHNLGASFVAERSP